MFEAEAAALQALRVEIADLERELLQLDRSIRPIPEPERLSAALLRNDEAWRTWLSDRRKNLLTRRARLAAEEDLALDRARFALGRASLLKKILLDGKPVRDA